MASFRSGFDRGSTAVVAWWCTSDGSEVALRKYEARFAVWESATAFPVPLAKLLDDGFLTSGGGENGAAVIELAEPFLANGGVDDVAVVEGIDDVIEFAEDFLTNGGCADAPGWDGTPVMEFAEDFRTKGGAGDDEDADSDDVIELAEVFRVRGGGGPTKVRGRTDFGGVTAEGTSCFSLSNSSVGGGEGEEGKGGESDGEVGGY